MRLIIAGGGTGGHLFPGIAIAEELMARESKNEVLFAGTEKGIEARLLPKLGWPLRLIPAEGIKGKGVIAKARAMFKLVPGFFESKRIIKEFKPEAVIGVGGYASAPMLLAARVSGIKTAVHEQNALPGLTNRMLGKVVDKVFVTFPGSSSWFPSGKVVVSGNPLRKEIVGGLKREAGGNREGKKKTLLIFGGSAGAHRINMAALEMIGLMNEPDRWSIIHQTGEKDYKDVKDGYIAADWTADVRPFIYDMVSAYKNADLVICRAGATTVSELASAGKPAILIPYPYAADDHQRVNAESLVSAGGAVMLLEKDLSGERLASEAERLLSDENILERMGQSAAKMARIDAAKILVDGIYKLLNR